MTNDKRYEPYVPPSHSVKKKGHRKGRRAYQQRWCIEMRKLPCHYCGEPGGTIDHVIPKGKGGKTVPENCIPACRPCNGFRGDRPYGEFKEIGWKERRRF